MFIKILSTAPRGTTFVSPLTIIASFFANSSFIEFTIISSCSTSNPSSIITEQVRYFGFAPIIAKSLQVPQMASFPIFAPLKKRGLTVKLSVLKASFPFSITAASSLFSKISFLKAS